MVMVRGGRCHRGVVGQIRQKKVIVHFETQAPISHKNGSSGVLESPEPEPEKVPDPLFIK